MYITKSSKSSSSATTRLLIGLSLIIALLFISIVAVSASSNNEATTTTTTTTTTTPSLKDIHHDEESEIEETTITASITVKEDDLANQTSSASGNATGTSGSSSNVAKANGKAKNKSKRTIQITVPKIYEKYQLKPRVIGEDQKIRIYNAQNTTFYQRKLKNPVLKLWILMVGRRMKNNLPYYTYSAKRFFETAWKRNIQVELMEIQKFDLLVSHDGSNSIIYDGEIVPRENFPDAVLPRLGAHIDYWGLAVVRQFEKMDVLVLNGFDSLEMTRDKLQTLQQLAKDQIPIPKTMIARFPIDTSVISRHFTFPIVLKKSSGSQGKGVMLIQNEE